MEFTAPEVEGEMPSADTTRPSKSDTHTRMRVLKRNGTYEPADLNKIVKAMKTIGGLVDGTSTRALDELSIQTAASFMADEPQYSFLAARLLSNYMAKEVSNQNIWSFSQSIERGYELGIINDTLRDFVSENARKLNQSIRNDRNNLFHYFGLRTT